MTSPGKYVRAPLYVDSDSEENFEESLSTAAFEDTESETDDVVQIPKPITKSPEKSETMKRMDHFASLLQALIEKDRKETTSADEENDQNWGYGPDESCTPVEENSNSFIRWDMIPSFPKDVPSNKLWESWQNFLENFEIYASLSKSSDPMQRTKLLYLAMGSNLQGIVKAARLKPSLKDPRCYSTFVKNVDAHLRSMTDTAAEHEAFSLMRQEPNESAVIFHSRLTAKVRLCGYSRRDEDRFIRAQLVKGMSNRDLAKEARTHDYSTNQIVQMATKSEVYDAENARAAPSALAVDKKPWEHRQSNYRRENPPQNVVKRKYHQDRRQGNGSDDELNRKHRKGTPRDYQKGRRSRCWRCDYVHRGTTCPAKHRPCIRCGKNGHFIATCKENKVHSIDEVEKNTIIEKTESDQVQF
ncbi:uncharacterized protein LOC129743111 [Uranotaenia lowii]|uniref:uncharacterized protein LOC129743111 n=1 Tax=Uranotaenia lowii TaxID=190385 RepID=UPI00247A102F|nr:uncharacterized protein LOC129743111 [Uranotaenia lowii]